jgi:hypothetical protein
MLDKTVILFAILGNLALVVSVLLVLREVRENVRQTRVAHAHSLVELASPLYLGLVQDRSMVDDNDIGDPQEAEQRPQCQGQREGGDLDRGGPPGGQRCADGQSGRTAHGITPQNRRAGGVSPLLRKTGA